MESQIEDLEYLTIVNNILNNDEFKKLKNIEHHGMTRYDHSVRVSYYSYKVAKALHLNYVETARGGLLHDFFISKEDRTNLERFTSTFTHPKLALKTTQANFDITKREADMIRSHMFPINISVPTYAESWIVSSVDKFVATSEFSMKVEFRMKYAYNVMLIFLFSFMR